MQKNKKRVISICFMISACFCFSACGTVNEEQVVEKSETNISGEYDFQWESSEEDRNEEDNTTGNNTGNVEESEPDWTNYGEMKTTHEEFQNEDGSTAFYYDMECFYFNDVYPEVLNETLQAYYASVEQSYLQDSQVYTEPLGKNENIPYDSLIFQYFTYVDEEYVSLVYNNVCYMGGANPYSALDGITINCTTGEIVTAQQFLNDSDEKIAQRLQETLGMDSVSMNEWDYYLTKTSVVFFYYDPRFWEPVEIRRVK